MTATLAPAPALAPVTDLRLRAFCAGDAPEIFAAVVHANQVWMPDEFDVTSIHAEARITFAGLVDRATADNASYAKSLLLLGEAGSGKTHLMRAFRNMVHQDGTAYCGYLQMTTRLDNYARYVLSNLLDSLGQPYCLPNPMSGLSRLANGLLDALPSVSTEERKRLREAELAPTELAQFIHRFADEAVQQPRFANIDLDVLRACLYLLSDDARIRARILKWFRCEELSSYDRELLGDLVPRPQDFMPLRTLVDLGRLMQAVHGAALVLCVDQLEEMIDQTRTEKDPGEVFRRVIDTLVTITGVIPSAVVVIACLEDYYTVARSYLTRAKLDRLERDPEPMRLSSIRTEEEIAALLTQRLRVLYDASDLAPDLDDPLFPFRPEHLRPLGNMRTRDALDWFRRHHLTCMAAGTWVDPSPATLAAPNGEPRSDAGQNAGPSDLELRWNDFVNGFQTPGLDDEEQIAKLLLESLRALSAEMPEGHHFDGDVHGRYVTVEAHGADKIVNKFLIAVCEKRAQGGGLAKQIDEVVQRASDLPAVLVRSTEFPKGPGTAISKRIAGLLAPKGTWRRAMVEQADWRAMTAFQVFHAQHHADPAFAAWQKAERPLSRLPSLNTILALESKPRATNVTKPAAPTLPTPSVAPMASPKPHLEAPRPTVSGAMLLGRTRGATAAEVRIEPKELTQHAAFLGGPGSGKTTAALTLIEQLLERGIPAVLLDRKGDLSRYADPEAWEDASLDPGQTECRQRLRAGIEVAVYTPGASQGRPLALPVVPADLAELPETEREQIGRFTAAALGAMLGYRTKAIDAKMAILGKAIEVLGSIPGRELSVRGLQQLIEDQDDTLVQAVGGLDGKHYKRLAEDLMTLMLQRENLLGTKGETLDIGTLLGKGLANRARLSILNLQFLGGSDAMDFWVSQFLVAVGRWAARHPAPGGQLQAVFLFDEADQYLPATRQPATKGPMENLLRRARSAGLSLFLATQSPGDLDYKCRDQIRLWLIGRVKEPVAIAKLKPMLEAAKMDAASRLSGQGTGQFFLVREREVTPVQTSPSLIPTAQVPEDRVLRLAVDPRS